MRLRHVIPVFAGALAVVLVVVLTVILTSGPSIRTIKVDFAEAPGLYPGNHVDVLGIPVGTVTALSPKPGYVEVTLQVNTNITVPAGAAAELMAPQVVADRFVELEPAYTGGPALATGSTIPVERTIVPESVDDELRTLTNLAQQLGPNGANNNGALAQMLDRLAAQLAGNGPAFHAAVTNFSGAMQALADASPQLETLMQNLGPLSQALASNADTYQAFAGDLSSVSSVLAADRQDVGSVLANLQQALGDLNTFVTNNEGTLGASLTSLQSFAGALAQQQDALAKAFDIGPLTLQNLDNTIDKNAPGGPALRSRYDPEAATVGLFNSVCGNTALRFLVVLATGTETNPLTVATPTDTICAVGNALTALTPPPGAAPGPNLSLTAFVPRS